MKILVLSLLRAGDIVLQRPLFKALKQQSPECELHLLMNDEVSWIAGILKEVDHIHIFPRKMLQRLVGEGEHNIFRAHLQLSEFLTSLNEQKFDEVINFTHNRLSAYLAEEVSAPLKKGLFTEGPRFHGLENRWLKLFNDRFAGTQAFPFHYTEILAHCFNLKVDPPVAPENSKIKRVFLQVLTSDPKKNWGLSNFRNLLNELYSEYPYLTLKILAAESEIPTLENYFENEEICTWNLEKIEMEMGPSDLLITGDTVTMHLAAQKSAQIIELALGSSDPWKTGPFASDHYILTSKVACWPCVHSKPCGQISHLCGEPIQPKTVTTLIRHLIQQSPEAEILSSVSETVQLFKSKIASSGYELVSKGPAKDQRILNKIVWKKIFDPEFEPQTLSKLDFGIPRATLAEWQYDLKEKLYVLQSEFENLVHKLGSDHLSLFDVQEARRKMGALASTQGNQEWIWMFTDLAKLSFSTPLHFLSAFQDRLEILKGAIFYRDELMTPTKRGLYESRSGKISESGLAET